MPISNGEILLAAGYESPRRIWSDTDITEVLRFRNKTTLACDLNAKRKFRDTAVSSPSKEIF